MERKKKKCKDCGKPSYIKGHGRCEYCYNAWYATNNSDKLLKRNRVSSKKQSLKQRPKKTRRQKLIDDIDRYHSLYIRLKESDDSGLLRCFTCDSLLSWKRGYVKGLESAQACHFMSRGFMSTRWLDNNVHAGCNDCNVHKNGNLQVYEQRMIERYGEEEVQRIKFLAHDLHKFSEVELSSLLYKVKKQYQELRKEKKI